MKKIDVNPVSTATNEPTTRLTWISRKPRIVGFGFNSQMMN